MPPRQPVVTVSSAPNDAGALSVVEVSELRALCEQVAQERCPIWIRVWTTPDGTELIELHRVGDASTEPPTTLRSSEVF
jgi:hypothetical protein